MGVAPVVAAGSLLLELMSLLRQLRSGRSRFERGKLRHRLDRERCRCCGVRVKGAASTRPALCCLERVVVEDELIRVAADHEPSAGVAGALLCYRRALATTNETDSINTTVTGPRNDIPRADL